MPLIEVTYGPGVPEATLRELGERLHRAAWEQSE